MQPHTSSHTTLTATCTTSSASTCSRGTTGATGGLKAHRRSLTCAVMVRPHAVRYACCRKAGVLTMSLHLPACLSPYCTSADCIVRHVRSTHNPGKLIVHGESIGVRVFPRLQLVAACRLTCARAMCAGCGCSADRCEWPGRLPGCGSQLCGASVGRGAAHRCATGARFVVSGLPALTLPSLLRCGFACSQAGGPGRV